MLQFKDIKPNNTVFIFNKKEMTIVPGKATNVLFPPRMDIDKSTGRSQMVTDITIEVNGKSNVYAIPESLSVTYAGDLILATEKQGLLNDVEAVVHDAEQIIAQSEHAKMVLEKAPALRADLSPAFREKQETEKRFGKIEDSIKETRESVNEINSMLKSLMKELKG